MTPFEAPKKLQFEKIQSSEDDAGGARKADIVVPGRHVSKVPPEAEISLRLLQ
jgi:hypothetical protein